MLHDIPNYFLTRQGIDDKSCKNYHGLRTAALIISLILAFLVGMGVYFLIMKAGCKVTSNAKCPR